MQSLIGKVLLLVFVFLLSFFFFFSVAHKLVIFQNFTPPPTLNTLPLKHTQHTHDTTHSWVHHDALLRWIQDKKMEHASAAEQSAPMPVPLEESAIQRELVLQRHLSGFTPQQLRYVLCVCCVVVSFFCLFCLFLSQSNQIFSLFCHNLTSYILYIYYFLLFFNGTLIFLLFVFSFLSLLFSSFSF